MNARRTLAVLSAACILALVLSGCYPIAVAGLAGSGKLVTKDLDITGFNTVDAGGAYKVTITQGESYMVSVTADDNIWEHVVAQKEGDTLRLGTRGLVSVGRVTLIAEVTMPSLTRVNFSGATSGTINGFKSQSALTAEASGASRLSGDVQAGNTRLEASGASTISLSGSADALTLDASGASTADLPNFAVNTANVNLSGASRANINVKSKLDYDLSGACRLTFTGNPSMGRMETSGGSSVEHK